MRTEKEKMLAGENYLAADPELLGERIKAKKLLHRLNVTEYVVEESALATLRELLPNAGENIYIEPPFHCDYGYNIYTGKNVYFNVNCVVLDVLPVTIGNNVLFGPNVQVYTATHPLDAMERRTVESGQEITIGNDCWIGGGAIICPGVHIGDKCVVGAGAVVTKDIPANSLAVGSPAKVIRSFED